MKKLTYLLLALIILACSDDNEGGNNSNSIDYFFEVEFGGVINRVEGNYSFILGDCNGLHDLRKQNIRCFVNNSEECFK